MNADKSGGSSPVNIANAIDIAGPIHGNERPSVVFFSMRRSQFAHRHARKVEPESSGNKKSRDPQRVHAG